MQIGIVGFPYSGKTTFFQTLTETNIDASQHKRDANQAIIKVPDERLDKLTAMFNPKKKINATIEIVDFAGVQKNDANASAFDTAFMTKVRTNDALIHVVRGFRDETVPHIEGNIDMLRDIRTLEDEFMLNDLAFCETRLQKLALDIQKNKNKDQAIKEKAVIEKWFEVLQNETPLRALDFNEEEEKLIRNYQLLTAKPLLIALNLDENDIDTADEITKKLTEEFSGTNITIEPFFAKIEMELMQLDTEEKQMFMEEYGLTESALSRLIKSAYRLLGVISFFTVGEDECRAWPIKEGFTAQEAAGTIHTDFYNKFIRAEVVDYDDFMKYTSFAACKEHGVFRLEGKEYIVKDGDILHVRHG
jgi:GTP-binding protein YchF